MYDPQFCELSGNVTPDCNVINAAENHGHSWLNSDITLSYINKLLMQEDSDDKVKLHHGESALRAVEEPFYRLLGQNHPAYPQLLPLLSCDYLKNLDDSTSQSHRESRSSCSVAIDSRNNHSNNNLQGSEAPWSLSAIVGERKKFSQDTYRMEFNVNDLSIAERPNRGDRDLSVQVNSGDTKKSSSLEVQSRKAYPCMEDFDLLEGRSNKQFAISSDEPIRDEMFDKVLLSSGHKHLDGGIISEGTTTTKSTENSLNNQGRTSARRRIKGKKQQKNEVVDLRTLLIHCAQAVSVNNHTLTIDILNTIRQHSSASGDDSQRLAFCLADCLEVRLAGYGSQIYRELTYKPRRARDMLKIVHLCLKISPFLRAPYCFANRTIFDASIGKSQVHIIDFGICFGFQWPSLFEQLAKREGGPPKVRITGIELPQPGFRPDQMNVDAGQRLAEYANMFNIPFEYQGISSKWETLRVEDFNIQKDDMLIVNCIHRMKNLGDETVSANSARNRVLNTIRMMKPTVFVLGVLNGSYSSPFFLTRFKEVMYHYTAMFDVLDKTVPPDNEERMTIEREFYLSILINVLACEGSERIERPESYKKWKSRNLNAGFEQLPLNPEIVKRTKDMVKQEYHKDYVVNEDDQWLLLGWKGRILYAISTWKPNESNDDGD
ncbi:hypothetical protein QOZ80_3AG0225920 [Eleusine coracana subsp. coracana]|nr:hypothetical protein QOZ80_3AG0225920 [Eleusine coracana subsp. coracana]